MESRKRNSPSNFSKILIFCFYDGLGFAATVLLISGAYGLFNVKAGFNILTTLKWTGIAFLVGCIWGLRRLFK